MVNSDGSNWYHRISDSIGEVSYKPMSLQPGSTVFIIWCHLFVCVRCKRELLQRSVHHVSDQVIQEGTVPCGLFNSFIPVCVIRTKKYKNFS
jgi:hypothetical protein